MYIQIDAISQLYWHCTQGDLTQKKSHISKSCTKFGLPYEDGPMAATMRTNLSKLRPTNIFHTRTPVQDFNSFSIMFYTTLLSSTIYQKIGDIFYSLIFMEFRTVWIHHIVITIRQRFMRKDSQRLLLLYVNLIRACLNFDQFDHQLVYMGPRICVG